MYRKFCHYNMELFFLNVLRYFIFRFSFYILQSVKHSMFLPSTSHLNLHIKFSIIKIKYNPAKGTKLYLSEKIYTSLLYKCKFK